MVAVAFAARCAQGGVVIASVGFRNFKALRNACVRLTPFNLVLGPNGSGKTSLIEALLHLRALSKLPPSSPATEATGSDRAEIAFEFFPPHENVHVRLRCIDAEVCDALDVMPAGAPGWPALKAEISRIRSFVFDYAAMAEPSRIGDGAELARDGANLAAYVAGLQQRDPVAHRWFVDEALRLFPEYAALAVEARGEARCTLAFSLAGERATVPAENLSQGTLHLLAVLALATASVERSVICIEEIDRGVHPRMLREVRDALYRLAYPSTFGLARPPVQVIATTHSPYLLDLFREHPEEVILTQKHGREAHFERLSERTDLTAILEDSALGDLWFSGILGGVPEEKP